MHLARRFFGALDPRGPSPSEEGWALSLLVDGEPRLWRRMSGPDRRHAAGVARDVASALGADATRPVLAAALLHDVGKIDAGIGTLARVPATLLGLVARDRFAAGEGRVARYLRHDEIGGRMLAQAGSDPLTSTWAAEHHLPPDRWTLPRPIADALKSADGD